MLLRHQNAHVAFFRGLQGLFNENILVRAPALSQRAQHKKHALEKTGGHKDCYQRDFHCMVPGHLAPLQPVERPKSKHLIFFFVVLIHKKNIFLNYI
tara:strand:+ start:199 stop:489 length:291 start_codon:yes stop_codon:yes gene_type:complete